MLRPRELEEYVCILNEVARDALESMSARRETEGKTEGEIPDLEGELLKWTAECKEFSVLERISPLLVVPM